MSEREAARDMLRELLAEALAGGNGNGVVPQVPAPPVAAVLRPSTWPAPPTGAEVVGGGMAPAPPGGAAAGGGMAPAGAPSASGRPAPEPVRLDSDADLDRFVRALAVRLEDPAAREAARTGRLRFTLGRGPSAPPGGVRVDRGAVTERKVQAAAKAGGRLVLGRAAVLTPLAREKARALGIEIERE